MKKSLVMLLAAMMCLLTVLPAVSETADAVSGASVSDFYADSALTGDDLMNAINSFSGFYLVSTTNPDGTANAAFFIFGCVAHEGAYYLKLGLAENQSRQNLLANGEGLAVYAAAPSADADAKPYAVAGARMRLAVVTDEAILSALEVEAGGSTLLCEVTEIKPLG